MITKLVLFLGFEPATLTSAAHDDRSRVGEVVEMEAAALVLELHGHVAALLLAHGQLVGVVACEQTTQTQTRARATGGEDMLLNRYIEALCITYA